MRLFLAAWPDDGVRQALGEWRERWTWPRAASLVPNERLHLTLHFLGVLPGVRLPELIDALRVPITPFQLDLGHAALWTNGVAVLEPDSIPVQLLQLQADLGLALEALALTPDARAYRPHVTLARRAAGAVAPTSGPHISWQVERYALMASTLGPGGGYTCLHEYG